MNLQNNLIKSFLFGALFALFSATFLSGVMFLFMDELFASSSYAWLLTVVGLIGVIAIILVANHLGYWSMSRYRQKSVLFGAPIGMVIGVINVLLIAMWSAVLLFDIHEYFAADQMVLIYAAILVTIFAMVFTLILKAKLITKHNE